MGEYEDQLRHVAEPAAPSEREKANAATIEDHVALWLTDHLRDFSHYGDTEGDQGGIALAYASYIDQKVRDEGQSWVSLYVHTEQAAETLLDALYAAVPAMEDRADIPMIFVRDCEEAFAEVYAAFVEDADVDGPGEPTITEIDGERTVVFDEEDARESYAMMQMHEAESEALARAEREAEGRGVNNLPENNPALRGGR
jgi:hypothetical protein